MPVVIENYPLNWPLSLCPQAMQVDGLLEASSVQIPASWPKLTGSGEDAQLTQGPLKFLLWELWRRTGDALFEAEFIMWAWKLAVTILCKVDWRTEREGNTCTESIGETEKRTALVLCGFPAPSSVSSFGCHETPYHKPPISAETSFISIISLFFQ